MGKSGTPWWMITPNTSVNTARYRIGFSMAHAAPRTEDLYLTLTSLRTRFHRIWRAPDSSRARGTTWSRGGSEVWTWSSSVAVDIGSPARPARKRAGERVRRSVASGLEAPDRECSTNVEKLWRPRTRAS